VDSGVVGLGPPRHSRLRRKAEALAWEPVVVPAGLPDVGAPADELSGLVDQPGRYIILKPNIFSSS